MRKTFLLFLLSLASVSTGVYSGEIRMLKDSDYAFVYDALSNNENLLVPESDVQYPDGLNLEERISKSINYVFYDDDYITKVYTEDGQPIGFITYTKKPFRFATNLACIFGNQRYGIIQIVYVDSKYHRKGIGTSLMQDVLQDMKSKGTEVVELKTEIRNTAARSLYEKFGFILKYTFPNNLDCLYKKIL